MVDKKNSTLDRGEEAYAKLVSENFRVFYMTELEVEIGREKKDNDPKYFCLAETGTLSKQHAKIFWDKDQNDFFIKNLSKNKIHVDFQELTNEKPPMRLKNMCPILMAKIKLYFLLPQDK
ncbi:fork head transcription factor 1 [Stylonychia lemnae]|uniref:Fork head transcription factor 1 n=1 Tax=Stylonychia lemnae TaxID=5949 RepID=A0A078AKJ3_STYLE|nr:fork head transcription factor 1 [Stylonychia lemnae]|eukprot:CDW82396.1 fork head transcription factor 1 [Stylonychia lemnae]